MSMPSSPMPSAPAPSPMTSTEPAMSPEPAPAAAPAPVNLAAPMPAPAPMPLGSAPMASATHTAPPAMPTPAAAAPMKPATPASADPLAAERKKRMIRVGAGLVILAIVAGFAYYMLSSAPTVYKGSVDGVLGLPTNGGITQPSPDSTPTMGLPEDGSRIPTTVDRGGVIQPDEIEKTPRPGAEDFLDGTTIDKLTGADPRLGEVSGTADINALKTAAALCAQRGGSWKEDRATCIEVPGDNPLPSAAPAAEPSLDVTLPDYWFDRQAAPESGSGPRVVIDEEPDVDLLRPGLVAINPNQGPEVLPPAPEPDVDLLRPDLTRVVYPDQGPEVLPPADEPAAPPPAAAPAPAAAPCRTLSSITSPPAGLRNAELSTTPSRQEDCPQFLSPSFAPLVVIDEPEDDELLELIDPEPADGNGGVIISGTLGQLNTGSSDPNGGSAIPADDSGQQGVDPALAAERARAAYLEGVISQLNQNNSGSTGSTGSIDLELARLRSELEGLRNSAGSGSGAPATTSAAVPAAVVDLAPPGDSGTATTAQPTQSAQNVAPSQTDYERLRTLQAAARASANIGAVTPQTTPAQIQPTAAASATASAVHGAAIRGETGPGMLAYPLVAALATNIAYWNRRRKKLARK